MKKKLLLAAGAMLAAAAVSAFVYVNNERNSMSDLFNANVEALVRNEGSGRAICYSQSSVNDNMRCLECSSCEYVNGAGVDKGRYCKW